MYNVNISRQIFDIDMRYNVYGIIIKYCKYKNIILFLNDFIHE